MKGLGVNEAWGFWVEVRVGSDLIHPSTGFVCVASLFLFQKGTGYFKTHTYQHSREKPKGIKHVKTKVGEKLFKLIKKKRDLFLMDMYSTT